MVLFQLLGDSHGLSGPMELDIGCGGCLLCICQVLTSSTKNDSDSRLRRLGMGSFLLKSILIRFLLDNLNSYVYVVLPQALSHLLLSAACSTASVTDLLFDAGGSYCRAKLCSRYQLSAAMAFLSWFLCQGSFLFNLWLLPSL